MTQMHPDHPTYRGVPVPAAMAKAAQYAEPDPDSYASGWKDGVDAHYARTLELAAARQGAEGPSVLKLTGWARDSVRAFGFVADDSEDTSRAREIIRRMSPKERAVLQHVLRTVSRLAEEEDSFVETRDRRQAREDVLGDG